MLRLIHRRAEDRGAIAAIAAIVCGTLVLTGVAALTIDAGSLYAERRVVQNGADAASLALAQICANDIADAGCANTPYLQDLAGDNAEDGLSSIFSVCGSGPLAGPKFGACPTGTELIDCVTSPNPIPASLNFVEVRTRTLSPGATPSVVRSFVAGLGDPSYDGQMVQACARAAWAPPAGGSATIPVTISLCEWNDLTANGTNFIGSGPYSDPYLSPDLSPGVAYPAPGPSTYEKRLLLHDTTGSTSCPAGPSGADLPGGFGWLETTGADCEVNVPATGWVNDDLGNSPPAGCSLAPLVGSVAYIPIYRNTNGLGGSNGEYLLDGFAAFYFTGYSIPNDRPRSIATNTRLCTPSQTCLYGWFTRGIIPVGTFLAGGGGGSGTPRGAIAVGVAG